MKATIYLTDEECAILNIDCNTFLKSLFDLRLRIVEFTEKELSDALYHLKDNHALRNRLQKAGEMVFRW